MTSPKHKLLFAFISLQLLGALILIAAFFVEIWAFELLLSFTPLLMTVLAISLIISTILVALLGRFRQSGPLLAVAGVTWLAALFVASYAFTLQAPATLAPSNNETITFATFNKLYSNHDTERFTDYLKQQNIDILALQEMRPTEVPSVAERLGFEYTHTSRTFATSGGTSVVLLSRFPFVSVETVELATGHPVIRAEIETPESGNVVVYSAHIPVPSSKFLYNKRNIVLGSFAETIQQEKLPVIIGGDFNTTVFSPAMRTFSREAAPSIKPVAAEKIPACSWYGYGPIMCVRIDHIYAPVNAQIVDFKIAPDLGADHRALIAEIAL